MTATTETAYLDTNILVAMAFEEEHNKPKIESLLKDLKEGKYIAIISYLTLMEFLNAIRKKLTKNYSIDSDLNKIIKEIDNDSKRIYKDVIDLLIRFDPSKVRISSAYYVRVDRDLFHLLETKIGKIIKIRCNCGKSDILFYKGLNAADILHISVAKSLYTDYFITFDKDFKEIISEEYIKGMKIIIK